MTTFGYTETVTEAEWSDAFLYAGATGAVASPAAWKVSRVSGFRRVKIAAGIGFAAGIQEQRGSDSFLDLPQPLGPLGQPSTTLGQWWLVVAAYTRATETVTFEAVAGPTTGTTTPARAPFTWPSLRRDGNVFQQPLAWCWVHPTDVAKYVDVDLRMLPDRTPASLINDGIFRWVRTGAPFDQVGGGQTGQLLGSYSSNVHLPRGVWQYEGIALTNTAESVSTVSYSWITINDEIFARHRNDQDIAVRELTEVRTFKHPGGVLTTDWSYRPDNQTVRVLRDGTEASLSWQRPLAL